MSAEENAKSIVAEVQRLRPTEGRKLIAIAGPPAGGKSTVAGLVRAGLEEAGGPCGLLPMDGFHLDNEKLTELGLLSRKGAPETFDLEGFASTLKRLTVEDEVAVPLFDRSLDAVLPAADLIGKDQRHVVIEGNYLLLDEPGWRDLSSDWTFSVFVSASIEELRERLVQRWLDHGLTPKDAEKRAAENDLVNAQRVLSKRLSDKIDMLLF